MSSPNQHQKVSSLPKPYILYFNNSTDNNSLPATENLTHGEVGITWKGAVGHCREEVDGALNGVVSQKGKNLI